MDSTSNNNFTEHECILLVDDIEDDLNKMKDFLSPIGAHILCATNMDEALDILQQKHITMLITDIIFPMYRLTKEEYSDWIEHTKVSHYYLRTGSLSETVTRSKVLKKETEEYSEFSGFKLLDEVSKINPLLPVIIVSRYADLEMARKAIGAKVKDILSKEKHFDNPDILLKSVSQNMIPITQRLQNMGREGILQFFCNITERIFVSSVLIPLFCKLGYRQVRDVHGAKECGIDLIFYETDNMGIRRYIGVQAKVKNIHRNVGTQNNNIMTIINQIQLAFESSFYILPDKNEIRVDRIIIVGSQIISKDAKDYIRESLRGKIFYQHIEFMDNLAVVDFILK